MSEVIRLETADSDMPSAGTCLVFMRCISIGPKTGYDFNNPLEAHLPGVVPHAAKKCRKHAVGESDDLERLVLEHKPLRAVAGCCRKLQDVLKPAR